MRFKFLVIVLLALMFSGCNRSTSETSVSNPTPLPSALPTSTPLNDFDEALQFIRNGQFTYIWVFTAKMESHLTKPTVHPANKSPANR